MTQILTSEFLEATQKLSTTPAWFRALTLRERLKISATPAATDFQNRKAERRLKAWKEQSLFRRESAYWTERLDSDKLDETEFFKYLGQSETALQADAGEIPLWAKEISAAFEHFDPFAPSVCPALPPEQNSGVLAMQAIQPLVEDAVSRFRQGVAELQERYIQLPFETETTVKIFFGHLPNLLVPKLNQTFALEVNIARLRDKLVGETPNERFANWIKQLGLEGGIVALFDEYPVLARTLHTTLTNWLATSLEFLERLCLDWQALTRTFSPDNEPGLLMGVEGGAGDSHRGGHTVLRLSFSSGLRLVYKPKSLAIDCHFQELLGWLNGHGVQPPFRLLKLLDRGSYGWSEFITAAPCRAQAELERFYERQGSYLALLYALEATDFHYENLIAAGEYPILIDLEALLHPHVGGVDLSQSEGLAANQIAYSVLRVGLLPQRVWGNNGNAGVDLSGLSGQGGQLSPRASLLSNAWGTDQMRMVRQQLTIPHSQNRARLVLEETSPAANPEQPIEVERYAVQIRAAFERTYRLLMTYRHELMEAGCILARLAEDEIRIVLRPTGIYGKILHESYHPDLLRDALDRDRYFDYLWLGSDLRPFLKRVIQAEQADLWAGDIPMFTTRPNTCDIFTSQGEVVEGFCDEPSFELVKKRLLSLDEHDLTLQKWFIDASFASLAMGDGRAKWRPSGLQPTDASATALELLQAARRVGDRLGDLAIQLDNDASWVGLSMVREREWSLLPTGMDMYNGTAGIALFLAYLGEITKERRYAELARGSLTSLRRTIRHLREQSLKLPIGAFDGWGSMVYLYSHLGTLWQQPALYDEAHELVVEIDRVIAEDECLDIISGSAGSLLSIISLLKVAPDPATLKTALRCGDHLLAKAEPQQKGLGWRTVLGKEVALLGYSHGTTGIAHSLLELAILSGEERFQRGALEAFEYERSMYSPVERNWPDLRPPETQSPAAQAALAERDQPPFMTTWCHGAPGIGLGRAAALTHLDESVLRDELETALATTLAKGFGLNHSLCHGDLGNLETLLSASQVLERPDYHQQVYRIAAMILHSIERDGWSTGIPHAIESPGLMTGIAGIGYGLLRLAEPERVPSVLRLAAPVHPD
jgi:type 2 lantibiotic biosynthesis protein LanM